MKVALLHYSGPPIVGGVEQTLYYHSRSLADLGHETRLVVGAGQVFENRIPVVVIPELGSRHPGILETKRALDGGQVSRGFEGLRRRIGDSLHGVIAGLDALVVHNALTLHKNLALTAALWDFLQAGELPRTVGWHHDFAWDRPGYRHELHDGFPWDLLRRPWPRITNVVVSQSQRARLASLYGVPQEEIHVITPGVDPAIVGRWTRLTRRLVDELGLLQADAMLLLPARLTRRKNIEYALRVLAELRNLGHLDVRLLVTGPPGPHNPSNVAYLATLVKMRNELGLQKAAHFLYELDPDQPLHIDDDTMADLYGLSDALFFPSQDEGFGIPLLEAGLARLPIFCSDIPPFRESAGEEAHYFSLDQAPRQVAQDIADKLFAEPAFVFRSRVRRAYTWEQIVADKVVPILEGRDRG